MSKTLFELALIVLTSASLGVILKILRQPLIVAYLISGIAVGYFGWLNSHNQETFRLFADLGIMFLLFLVGLEINYDSLRMIGRPAVILGISQIIFTFSFGFLISKWFDFSNLASFYIAIALTFSSTIIIVKLLSEKRDVSSFYGKLSIGFLLVQDLVAILIIIFLTGISSGVDNKIIFNQTIFIILKGLIIFGLILYLGRKFLPYIFDKASRSQELLFLISLAWLFLMVALVNKIGFSIEVAGFLAGLGLANSAENFQIASRFRSLRDFFIMVFFIILGSSFVLNNVLSLSILWKILVFSLFVLVGNPLIVWVLMSVMGYRKRTTFLTGLTVAQISEFSLILVLMGLKIGHLSDEVVSLVTGVGVVTITLSTYLILGADQIFKKISKYFIFERKNALKDEKLDLEYKKPVILVGCHRTGQSIVENINPKNILVIDFDPDVISYLRKKGIDYIFGDISDPEVFEKINISSAKVFISTSPDFGDNMTILEEINKLPQKPKIILRAETEKDALLLYEKGADYVLLPHFTAGQYLGKTIAIDPEIKILEQLKKRDLEMLKSGII